jgi:hypothetical protein
VSDDWGFLKEGVKTYQMSPMLRLKVANFFSIFTSMVNAFETMLIIVVTLGFDFQEFL